MLIVACSAVFLILVWKMPAELLLRRRKQKLLKQRLEVALREARVSAREAELERFSRLLHTDLSGDLGILRRSIDCLVLPILDEKNLNAEWLKVNNLFEKLTVHLRELSHNMSSGLVTFRSFAESLSAFVGSFQNTKNSGIHFDTKGEPVDIEEKQSLSIIRIVGCALDNAIRHAQTSEISIIVDYAPDEILILILDNGVGFDLDSALKGRTLG